jgi:phosphatidylserine decarboxylase
MVSAYKKNASEVNERVTIGVEGAHARVLVHQITGLVARRIVCRVSEGEEVVQGQRYGLIKFGSCTELVVPASAEILVKAGDKVKGAETVLARFKP